MNALLRKILFFDRVSLVLVSAVILALVFNVMAFIYTADIESSNSKLVPEISDMQSLANEAMQIKNIVRSKEKKILLRKSKRVVQTLEKILKQLGLKAKTIKPLDKKKTEGFIEDNAELEIVDTDLNSIVNLIYVIESSPYPIKIKSAAIKTAFENPDKFILKLSVSLMSKG